MKISKISLMASALAAVTLASCSSDYLSTQPETSISTAEIGKSVEAAQLAVNGICSAMMTQYQSTSYNQLNGEPYFNTIYNEGLGQDDLCGLSLSQFGPEIITGGAPWQKDNYVLNALPWEYCYNIISQANLVIGSIDTAEGDEEQRDFVKAQALTLRAHAYTKLMQYYAPRWENSRNGEAKCAVYKVEAGIKDAPLCSMNDVFKLIYEDLTNAISLFEGSSFERSYKWQPDINIAYGVFARAAMIIHDYPKAQDMANKAQSGFSVMDNNTYLSGFFEDNNDFMWTCSADEADIYYWSWGSHHAVNGIYVKNWGEGAGAIDYDLYRKMDPQDIRRQCFLTPDKIDVLVAYNKAWNPGKLTADDWWNPNLVLESKNCDLSSGPIAKKDAGEDGKYGLYTVAIRYCQYYSQNIFKGNLSSTLNPDGFNAYYTAGASGDVLLSKGVYGTLAKIPFGAQFKFWSKAPYGTSAYPFMRCSEMVLTEAEAAYYNGDVVTAKNCLKKINDIRIPGYSCDKTGEALLDEIRLSRRLELWGEGFSWPDFKRWNLPIVRHAWKTKDPTSGNWMLDYAIDTPADANGGWRMLVPQSEWKYNNAINRDELEYD